MSNDPYRTPSSFDQVTTRRHISATATRPLAVTVLGVLFLIGGGIGFFGIVMLLRALLGSEAEQIRERAGMLPWIMLGGASFFTAIALAAGGGMLAGATWGWWIAVFSSFLPIVGSAFAAVLLLGTDQFGESHDDLLPHFIKFFGRILFNTLFLLYLYKDNVRDYFGVYDLSWWKSLGIPFAVAVVLQLAVSVGFPRLMFL